MKNTICLSFVKFMAVVCILNNVVTVVAATTLTISTPTQIIKPVSSPQGATPQEIHWGEFVASSDCSTDPEYDHAEEKLGDRIWTISVDGADCEMYNKNTKQWGGITTQKNDGSFSLRIKSDAAVQKTITVIITCAVEVFKTNANTPDRTPVVGEGTTSFTAWFVGLNTPMYYKRSGETAWKVVTSPVYVEEGGSLDFKVGKFPEDAPSWPGGFPQWTGVKSGSNEVITNVQFNTRSTSATDFKTETAKCGASKLTANVVVYDFDKLTLRDSGESENFASTKSGDDNTLYVLEGNTNGSASIDIILDWLPSDVPANFFYWKIERNNTAGAEWSTTNGTFSSSGTATSITWTRPSSGEIYRQYVVTAWFDTNGDGLHNSGESFRTLQVVVGHMEFFSIRSKKSQVGASDPPDTGKTVYSIQLADGTSTYQVKAKWLPTSFPSSRFIWKVNPSSGWNTSTGVLSGSEQFNDVVWSQGTNTSATRLFNFRAGFDRNKSGTLDVAEELKFLNANIAKINELKLTEIDNAGNVQHNTDAYGNNVSVSEISDITHSDATPAVPNDTITLVAYTDSNDTKVRLRISIDWTDSNVVVSDVGQYFRWKLDDGQGWSTSSGNCINGQVIELTWTKPTSGTIKKEFVLTAWADANNSGTYQTDEEKRTLKIKIKELPIVGVMGATIAMEGSNERVIKLQMGCADGSFHEEDIQVLFKIDWEVTNGNGINPEDFVGYDPSKNFWQTDIFQQGNGMIGSRGAAGYYITVPATSSTSGFIILKAADQSSLINEKMIENSRVTVLDNPRKYNVSPTKPAPSKKSSDLNIYQSVPISVVKGITRFGTPNNSPVLHFEDAISVEDVKQGGHGDCYFMAALLALADHSGGKTHIVEHTAQEKVGSNIKFEVEFEDGYWASNSKYYFNTNDQNFLSRGYQMSKISNDCHNDLNDVTPNLNYHRNNAPDIDDGAEIWVQLYESAWASHKGGWFNGGHVNDVWTELTTKNAQMVNTDGMTKDQIFQVIANARGQNKWICVATRIPDGFSLSGPYANNLPNGEHAYYFKDFTSPNSNGVVSLQLINPWGYSASLSQNNYGIDLDYSDLQVIYLVYILEPTP